MGEAHEDAARLLAGLVEQPVLDGYLKLVANGGCRLSEAAEVVGGTDVIEELRRRNMAWRRLRPGGEPTVLALPPDEALRGVFRARWASAARELQLVLDTIKRLDDPPVRGNGEGGDLGDQQAVQILSGGDETTRVSFSLVNEASREFMTFETAAFEIAPTIDALTGPPEGFAGQVRSRSIWEDAYLEDPGLNRLLTASVAAGEEVRIRPRLPMKLKLADATTALLPLTQTGVTKAILIRNPVICGALREFFNLVWRASSPLSGPAHPHDGFTDRELAMLQSLAAGHTRAHIAQRTKISLRSFDRQCADLRDRLGAATPYQMIANAFRRELLR